MAGDEEVGKSSETVAQPSGAAAPVFISYASQDAGTANQICRSLESQGIPCWIAPRDVKPGAQYADAIVRAINEAKAVVLVMSGSAVASAHVRKEVERASSKRYQADGNAYGIAEVYAYRGQPDEAMHWLERSYSQKEPFLFFVKTEIAPTMPANDPAFKAFLKKMNLPE
jgi:hypothetical protein